ncbi:MAG: hypothetical protein KC636_11060 [Myxococcales bacterium]|nr:hypothetical protein [Myxococcales bacterium]
MSTNLLPSAWKPWLPVMMSSWPSSSRSLTMNDEASGSEKLALIAPVAPLRIAPSTITSGAPSLSRSAIDGIRQVSAGAVHSSWPSPVNARGLPSCPQPTISLPGSPSMSPPASCLVAWSTPGTDHFSTTAPSTIEIACRTPAFL